MTVPSQDRTSIYRSITDKIIEAIEAGAGEFQMPWHVGATIGRPVNAVTGKAYQGVNVVALWAQGFVSGFPSGHWASFRQWKAAGGQVRRGERGTPILFYKPLDEASAAPSDEDGPKRFVARGSYVFNSAQIDGWSADPLPPKAPAVAIDAVEAAIQRTGAVITHGAALACYLPREDRIEMPDRERFYGTLTSSPTESYYAVLLHELVHWTGAAHRLDRALNGKFGSEDYAKEELVAELGAAFLCCDLGVAIEPRLDHAAYVQSWLGILKADSKALFQAASDAGKAATLLQLAQ